MKRGDKQKFDSRELVGRRVDVTPLFTRCGIATDRPIIITETRGMYPYKEKIEDNWAFFTAAGMKRLKEVLDGEGKEIKNIGIVGICSGVEGIAVEHIFKDTLRRLIVTDIDDEILNGTVTNIGGAAPNSKIQVEPLIGSFCEPIEKAGEKVDLVHANIPNLPAKGDEDMTRGAEKGTFLPRQLYDVYNPPKEFVGWALAAQYAYLTSAKKVINKGGTIITELGGRVPVKMIEKLFKVCGLKMQEVVVGFKEQTEALIDFEGYHAQEEEFGTKFEFYRFEESKELLAEQKIGNPTHLVSGAEVKELLSPFKVSAGEALALYKKGLAIGHTVHLYRGIK